MDFPQQYKVYFPENASPVADAPRSAPSFPVPQHPQSAPSSYRYPVPGQARGHACVAQDVAFPQANAACDHRPDEDWEGVHPPVQNAALQGQPQDLRFANMGYYNIANDQPSLHEHRDHAINYAGVALDVPAQVQAAPPVPIVIFDDPARNVAASPVQAFLDERPRQGPVPNGLANEVLRQLAILYLREHNSQVAGIHMEPGNARGVRVVITVELADL